MVLAIALLCGTVSAASAETLLMPPRDFLMGNAAAPNGPGAAGEVVWGVTTLPNHTLASPTTFTIDFGDGTAPVNGNVTDRSYIAVNHVFPVSGTFTITLSVTNGGNTETATTAVRVFNSAQISASQLRGVNTNRAIENGLRYLWTAQVGLQGNFPGGVETSWGGSYPEPWAALVVLAFENHGYHVPNDDSTPTGIYEKYVVRRGLNYIINNLESFHIGMTPLGYNPCVGSGSGPDPDGAGSALCVALRQVNSYEGYSTSLAILPLAASNALNRHVLEVKGVSNANFVDGKTIGEVLQRLVNGLAWGQGEFGFGRGSWSYGFNSGSGDGSTMGWNVLALLDAEASGITVPAFVKNEFKTYAIPFGVNNDGSFDYNPDNNPNNYGGLGSTNMAKVGIGLQTLFYADAVGIGDPRVLAGRNSANTRWLVPGPSAGYGCHNGTFNFGCAYGMFNAFKGLKLHGITTLPNVNRPDKDWYAEYVDWLLSTQGAPTSTGGGYWAYPHLSFSCCGSNDTPTLTAMAELILAPVALIAPDPTLFSTVGLGPATALLAPFGQHEVTAKATSAGGAPVPGATVQFEVLTGPNAGKTGQATTGANGEATFTYTDDGGPGRDTIQAFIGTLGSNVVEALWQVPECAPTSLSVQLSSPIFPLDQGWRGVTIVGAPGATVTQVCQDEPPNFENIASWAIDAQGVGTSAVQVRAQRSGTRTNPGNGRVYTIYFTAAACTGKVTVSVPTAPGGTAIDNGPLYNSVTGSSCNVPAIPQITSVPNVVGQTRAAATSLLAAQGLVLGQVSQLNSPTVPYGQVMSQLPAPSANVALGSAVALTISSGPASVAVPAVVNLGQSAASAAIGSAGLTANVVQVHDDNIAAGLVTTQSPIAGTQVPTGSPVVITVSLGKPTSAVPNLVGLPLTGAVSGVNGAGLSFGDVNLVHSDTIPDGIVISQSPAPSTVVPPGSFVNFDISLGPQPVPVPNVVGKIEADASASIVAANLTVGNVASANDAAVPAGQVISQTPGGGSLASPGSPVAFVLSLGPVMVNTPIVTGLPSAEAQAALVAIGLKIGTVTPQNHPSVPVGAVITQNPPAAAVVPLGSIASLTVSLGPTPVLVPNLIGQSQAAASATLVGATLTVGAVTEANSPSVPVGNVMGQNPLAGSTVLPGAPVSLVVSKGPVIVTVPGVVGQTQANAQTAITGVGLFLQSITFITNPATAGNVIAQTPAAGQSAVLGSPMTITVSLGTNSVTVPNVIGKTQASAATTLGGASLNVGTVQFSPSQTVPNGVVIDQNPPANTAAPSGSGVNLLISTGPTSATVPDVVGKLEGTAVAEILAAHLGVTVTFGTSPTVEAGKVISQAPAGGATAAEGSNVVISVSTGLSAATVPNLVDQPQGNASGVLTTAGLLLGDVTSQSSSKSAGTIIYQSPAAGASVPGNSEVDIVVSTGPVAGEAAFLNVSLSSQVLGAGNAASITSSVLDGFSVPVVPSPDVVFTIVPGPGATGTAPYINGSQVLTSADTRGPYTLRGVVDGTVVSGQVAFSVFNGDAASKNAQKFVKLGQAEQTVKEKIDALLQAYQNVGPATDVAQARNALTAALATVPVQGKDAMQRSTAVAPEHGFLPSLFALQSAGYPVTAQDNAFGNLIQQIDAKLNQIRAFYTALNPDATAGATDSVAQLNVLNSELQSLVDQLKALNPTPAGVVKFAPWINRLMGKTLPQHLHALGNRAITIAQQYPDPASLPAGVARLEEPGRFFEELNKRRLASSPAAFYSRTQPAFFGLLGLMGGSSLQMKLVNEIYGPIMTEVSEMIAVLALNGLIETYANTASLGDLVSGASLSFHAPGMGGSHIEGYGLDTTGAGGNETWFIGPEAFDLVKNLIQSFDASDVESIEDVWNYFEGIADAVDASFEGYERAHTQPDAVYPGGCLLDDSSGCAALVFNSGFPDVNSTRFPSPVIVLLHNTNNGSWSSGIFNFVP